MKLSLIVCWKEKKFVVFFENVSKIGVYCVAKSHNSTPSPSNPQNMLPENEMVKTKVVDNLTLGIGGIFSYFDEI